MKRRDKKMERNDCRQKKEDKNIYSTERERKKTHEETRQERQEANEQIVTRRQSLEDIYLLDSEPRLRWFISSSPSAVTVKSPRRVSSCFLETLAASDLTSKEVEEIAGEKESLFLPRVLFRLLKSTRLLSKF
jgi:hypothetical protein